MDNIQRIKKYRKNIAEDYKKFLLEGAEDKNYLEVRSLKFTRNPRLSSEYTDCALPLTFDFYSKCSMSCVYCFGYYFKSSNPSFSPEVRIPDVKKMILSLEGKKSNRRHDLFYKYFYKDRHILHWGGLTDPFCYYEKVNKRAFPLIKALGEFSYPTLFSFKGSTIFDDKYLSLFEKYSKQKNFAFQISIVSNSDKMARLIEIKVPSTTRRFEAMKILSNMGYFTSLRLRPFIIGITDKDLDILLERARDAGARSVSVEFFAADVRTSRAMKLRYKLLGEIIGTDLLPYFHDLSPSERGGYLRLNRLVKESYVKKIYKFCVDNDIIFACSDPDFKELNMTGCCCGLPENSEEYPLLNNWTRSQITWHLKELRREYHRTGKRGVLTFDKVYKDASGYFNDTYFSDDHVKTVGMCNVDRKRQTFGNMARMEWNNFRTPGNPRNYFHGKLMPVGLTAEKDIIYKYNPQEWEDRWKKEGIDLGK